MATNLPLGNRVLYLIVLIIPLAILLLLTVFLNLYSPSNANYKLTQCNQALLVWSVTNLRPAQEEFEYCPEYVLDIINEVRINNAKRSNSS